MTRKKVYVCSKYAGEVEKNVENAKRYSRAVVLAGHMPITPHLMYPLFLDDTNSSERSLGLAFGIELLSMCDELWVFGDTLSQGMKAEVEWAKQHHMPIVFGCENGCLMSLEKSA